MTFSSQTFYLIIKNSYYKQKILFVKIEKKIKKRNAKKIIIETKKITIVVQKTIDQKIDVIVNFESKTKIKSFNFKKFANNLNLISISIKSRFENISYEKRLITYEN